MSSLEDLPAYDPRVRLANYKREEAERKKRKLQDNAGRQQLLAIHSHEKEDLQWRLGLAKQGMGQEGIDLVLGKEKERHRKHAQEEEEKWEKEINIKIDEAYDRIEEAHSPRTQLRLTKEALELKEQKKLITAKKIHDKREKNKQKLLHKKELDAVEKRAQHGQHIMAVNRQHARLQAAMEKNAREKARILAMEVARATALFAQKPAIAAQEFARKAILYSLKARKKFTVDMHKQRKEYLALHTLQIPRIQR
jgi:hypothetical protein